jgi:hypothetical protein
MNKRIKELADQCWNNFYIGDYEVKTPDIFAEKFAKLIIKETLEVARAGIEFGDGMENAVYRYFEIGMTTEDKKTLIKELLGVEE